MSYSEWHRLSIVAKKFCHLFAQTLIYGWFDDIDEKKTKKKRHIFFKTT